VYLYVQWPPLKLEKKRSQQGVKADDITDPTLALYSNSEMSIHKKAKHKLPSWDERVCRTTIYTHFFFSPFYLLMGICK
jgi:hypothetical protein